MASTSPTGGTCQSSNKRNEQKLSKEISLCICMRILFNRLDINFFFHLKINKHASLSRRLLNRTTTECSRRRFASGASESDTRWKTMQQQSKIQVKQSHNSFTFHTLDNNGRSWCTWLDWCTAQKQISTWLLAVHCSGGTKSTHSEYSLQDEIRGRQQLGQRTNAHSIYYNNKKKMRMQLYNRLRL